MGKEGRKGRAGIHSVALTFREPPQLLGAEHAGGRDGVVADDPVVRVVHEARNCKERRKGRDGMRLNFIVCTRLDALHRRRQNRGGRDAIPEREEE